MDLSPTTIGALIEDTVTRRLQYFDEVPPTFISVDDLIINDIESLRGLIPRFLRRLNHLRCPTLRLPPEILQLILKDVVASTRDASGEDYPRRWLYLGHICSHLRTVLLTMHTIWADIVFHPHLHDAHEELLKRAGEAPFKTRIIASDRPEIVQFAERHLTRSRSIVAYLSATTRLFVPLLTSESFPYLEAITLTTSHDSTDSGFNLLAYAYDTSAILAPNLRHLSLENIFLPFDASALTTLSLKLPPTVALPPPGPFLNMLRRCTNLKEILLQGWIPDCSSPNLISESRIELPSLQRMSLEGQRLHVSRLWGLLRIPTTVYLDVIWATEHGFSVQVDSVSTFDDHIITLSDANVPDPLKLAVLGIHEECSIYICISRDGGPHATAGASGAAGLYVDMHSDTWMEDDINQAIGVVFRHYRHLNIAILDLDGEVLEILDFDHPVLANFPAAKTLTIQYASPSAIYHLGESLTGPHLSSSLVLPKLHTLELPNCSMVDNLELGDTLVNILRKRVEGGVPIQILNLVGSEIEPDMWEEIRSLVPTAHL